MKGEPSITGREQFYYWESEGTIPNSPNPFFLRLQDGKKWFNWQINEYRSLYLTDDWFGWEQLKEDWKGNESILRLLFKWMPNECLPDYLRNVPILIQ